MDGVLGHHGGSLDLVQHRVGNMDHLAIHNKNITENDLVNILLDDMEEDDMEEDDMEEDDMEEDDMEEDDIEEDDMEEDDIEENVVEDLWFSTNTSNVTHITVEVSTIDLKSQNNTRKSYLSNK
jgi:hypothetical protein